MPEPRLVILFEKLWGDIRSKVESITRDHGASEKSPKRDTNEILEEILALGREQSMLLAHPERFIGLSTDQLITKILGAYFESEASLSSQERNLVLALLGRWSALTNRLFTHFEREDLSLESDGLRRQLSNFQRYLNEANQKLTASPRR